MVFYPHFASKPGRVWLAKSLGRIIIRDEKSFHRMAEFLINTPPKLEKRKIMQKIKKE